MEVRNIILSKVSHVLSLSSCDGIFAMPFLNGRKLVIYFEEAVVILDDMDFLLSKIMMNLFVSRCPMA